MTNFCRTWISGYSILTAPRWSIHLSPARHLYCMTILLTQPHLTIQRCTTLNPSTLIPLPTDGHKHDCTAVIAEKVLPWSDWKDVPLSNPDMTLFVDGSSMKNPDGTSVTGYAEVTHDRSGNHRDRSYSPYWYTAKYIPWEKQYWKTKGCTIIDNIYTSPEGKLVLSKSLFRYAVVLTHGVTHVSNRGMTEMLNKVCTAYGFTKY